MILHCDRIKAGALLAYRSGSGRSGTLLASTRSGAFPENFRRCQSLSGSDASDQSSVQTAYKSRFIVAIFQGAAGGGTLPAWIARETAKWMKSRCRVKAMCFPA